MEGGRFFGGIAALIWSPQEDKYLLLRRSEDKDYAAGVWECVTGRVNQGEGFEDALQREVREELGVDVEIEYFLGTTHFYRGPQGAQNELIGVVFCCTLVNEGAVEVSPEHSEYRWVSAERAYTMLTAPDPSTLWMRQVIERAEAMREIVPPHLRDFYRQNGFELG